MWWTTRTLTKTLSTGLMVALVMQLLGCGSGSGSDNKDPYARIIFPTPNALTEADSIMVRGTAGDLGSGVASVTVNGKAATSSDGFANWTVELPLTQTGGQPLGIEVRDKAGNSSKTSAQAKLSVVPHLFQKPVAVAFDAVGTQALVIDRELRALLAVDLSSGARSLISGPGRGKGPEFSFPVDVAVDSQGNARVLDEDLAAIFQVDPATGDRKLVSGNLGSGNGVGSGVEFVFPKRLALAADDTVWVTDSGLEALIRVDPDSGERTLKSGEGQLGSGPGFFFPLGLVVEIDADPDPDLAWVVDEKTNALYKVTLSDGNREQFLTTEDFDNPALEPLDLALDGDIAWVVNDNALYRADLSAQRAGLVSGLGTGSGAVDFKSLNSLALDQQGQVWVADSELQALLKVDPNQGVRTLVSGNDHQGSGEPFSRPGGVALDGDGRAWMFDAGSDSLVEVDLASGKRDVVPTADDGVGIFGAEGLALDGQGRAWVVGSSDAQLVTIDLQSGARQLIADRADGLSGPRDVALDNDGLAWLIDSDLDALATVTEEGVVDLVSVPFGDSEGPVFDNPVGLALDDQNSAWVVDANLAALIQVDRSSGDRLVKSGAGEGSGDFDFVSPIDIALDDQGQAWVLDKGDGEDASPALFRVKLSDGARTRVSDASTGGTPLTEPFSLALDLERQLAWVTDQGKHALFAVDMTNGQRVIVAK